MRSITACSLASATLLAVAQYADASAMVMYFCAGMPWATAIWLAAMGLCNRRESELAPARVVRPRVPTSNLPPLGDPPPRTPQERP